MSLAQKFERSPAAKLDIVPAQPTVGGAAVSVLPRIATPIDFRQLTRRLPVAVPTATVAAPAPVVPPAVVQTAVADRGAQDVAMDLLREVSTALPTLMSHCQSLEESLAETREKARVEIEASREIANEYQQSTQALSNQVDRLEKEIAMLRQRAEAAEAENLSIRAMADQAQQAAAEAECLSSLFQEKVIASFGIGSAGHSILETVRNRTEQMMGA